MLEAVDQYTTLRVLSESALTVSMLQEVSLLY